MKSMIAAVALVATVATVHMANAKGCLSGAALGAVAGHLVHHTFLGMFSGCAGGLLVHHMYAAWKAKHPDGTMGEFVQDNRDKLPSGWAERLGTLSQHNIPAQ
jgi:hypothetical protein